ncbi:hypothetical protein [Streptomyces pakalii]|uniref:NHL repeat-containing protein n=1 Tax=Streptomyces pakalii TaxID=3036494 RepID=A0ABT7D830_9ACTN|nr:hypothetical protein [Streptomyces pakalii]MDJ1641968.1 hypothetical protein [Streptomyces pakalii]
MAGRPVGARCRRIGGGGSLSSDPAGALYIADFNNDRVVKLPVRGGRRTVPVAGLRAPAGLAIPSEHAGY